MTLRRRLPAGAMQRTGVLILWALLPAVLSAAAPQQGGEQRGPVIGEDRIAAIRAFVAEDVLFDQYLFPPGKFPSVRWKNPERVERLIGDVPLSVEFFDSAFAPVTVATHPGRYGAAVHGKTAEGFPVVRYATLYCCTVDLDDYSPDVPVSLEPLPGFGISPERWSMYRKDLRRFSFGSLLLSPKHDPDVAVFLAGLAELVPGSRETPRLRDRLWWTEFKRRRDGRQDTSLVPPNSASLPAGKARFQQGDPYTPQQLRQIRSVCRMWADSAGIPITVAVLHKGRTVFEGAFGTRTDGRPMTVGTPTWMASITKLLTGVLVMQFVDAGILELDAPLDRYLPELGPDCPLTLRHLMTHTSGLSWAGEWASDWNPSMENQVRQVLPILTPGKEFSYHRAGYALAAKVLERLSGRTVPALFQDHLFTPLRMTRSYADNSYGGLYATSGDLSRFGQMLLDRGRFGEARFLSEEAWRSLLPAPLHLGGSHSARSWGIGCSLQGGRGLSDSTFGHGAASGALLKIDPLHELVVVLGRDAVGADHRLYDRFVGRFLEAVTAPWKDGHE